MKDKLKLLGVILLLMVPSISWGGNFFSTIPKSEYLYDTVELMDISTTLDIKNHPGMYETNPLLGRHPSDAAIYAEGIGFGIIGHALITHELVVHNAPHWAVTAWEDVSIGVEAGYVGNNLALGLHFKL